MEPTECKDMNTIVDLLKNAGVWDKIKWHLDNKECLTAWDLHLMSLEALEKQMKENPIKYIEEYTAARSRQNKRKGEFQVPSKKNTKNQHQGNSDSRQVFEDVSEAPPSPVANATAANADKHEHDSAVDTSEAPRVPMPDTSGAPVGQNEHQGLAIESIGLNTFMEKLATIEGSMEKKKLIDLLQLKLKHSIDEFCQDNFEQNQPENITAPSTPSTSDWCIVTNPGTPTPQEISDHEMVFVKDSSETMITGNESPVSKEETGQSKNSGIAPPIKMIDFNLPDAAAPDINEVNDDRKNEAGLEAPTNRRKPCNERKRKVRCGLCKLVMKKEKLFAHLETHKKYVCKRCKMFVTDDKKKFKNHVKSCKKRY